MYVTACGRVCETYEVGVLHERSCDLCADIIAEEEDAEANEGLCEFCGDGFCDGWCDEEDEL